MDKDVGRFSYSLQYFWDVFISSAELLCNSFVLENYFK